MQGACDEAVVWVTNKLDVAAEMCSHVEVLDGDIVPFGILTKEAK